MIQETPILGASKTRGSTSKKGKGQKPQEEKPLHTDEDDDNDSFENVAGALAANVASMPAPDVPLPTVHRKEPLPKVALPSDLAPTDFKLLVAIEKAYEGKIPSCFRNVLIPSLSPNPPA